MSLCNTAARGWLFHRAAISAAPRCLRGFSSTLAAPGAPERREAKEQYDVIIAGGGMVGCTLACALAKNTVLSNLKVLLLEGSKKKTFKLKPEYSNRVVALNQNTKDLMSSLNVWRRVEQMRLQPVHHMQVWDACTDAMITFDQSDVDATIAYIVENDVLLHAVNLELDADSSHVNIVYGANIKEYELPKNDRDLSTVVLNDGDVYTCRLLIGADGANSKVRATMGVQYLSWSYEQMGVVATLHLAETGENSTAWQRFLPGGDLVALLPLAPSISSLVWSTSVPHAKQLLAASDEEFVDSLNDALWKQQPRNGLVDGALSWVRGALRSVGLNDGAARQLPPSVRSVQQHSRAAFPLGCGHSTRYVAPGVALVGDAAHRVHPLAGQGVNLGFGDVKQLVRLMADTVYRGGDIREASLLRQYETRRQCHNVPRQLAIEALHRVFAADLPPVQLARALGLHLTHAGTPLKKVIMSQAAT